MIEGVFVLGSPRSGTSALAWGLAQHPELWTSAESDFLLDLFGRGNLRTVYDKCYSRQDRGWLKKHEVSLEEFARSLGSGVRELFSSRSNGRIWIDQTPGYTLMAADLALMFPDAKFLHLVRDGRRVVCSMLKSGFPFSWAKDLPHAATAWKRYVEVGLEFEEHAGDKVMRVVNEDLVRSTQHTCREILAFLGFEQSDKPAEFLATKRINSSYDNVDGRDIRTVKEPTGLLAEPWTDWSAAERLLFKSIAGDINQRLGYGAD